MIPKVDTRYEAPNGQIFYKFEYNHYKTAKMGDFFFSFNKVYFYVMDGCFYFAFIDTDILKGSYPISPMCLDVKSINKMVNYITMSPAEHFDLVEIYSKVEHEIDLWSF